MISSCSESSMPVPFPYCMKNIFVFVNEGGKWFMARAFSYGMLSYWLHCLVYSIKKTVMGSVYHFSVELRR
ncbi:hypothetical protein BJF89_17155 [Corynebacterium sp. CNJ-954]|nr:hypothetical protein BJF89_17155 [Corynebacterium sp. CNJ-954]